MIEAFKVGCFAFIVMPIFQSIPMLNGLTTNSIRNKFENLHELLAGNVDTLSIAETKLDPSLPNS